MVLEKTLESSLDGKVKPVNPKRNQPWIFIGRTDAEAETPIFGHLMGKPSHWKGPWCWKRLKAGGEGNGRGWNGWLASLIQWTWVQANSGDSEGQGSLVCCSPWGCIESYMTEQLNNTGLWNASRPELWGGLGRHGPGGSLVNRLMRNSAPPWSTELSLVCSQRLNHQLLVILTWLLPGQAMLFVATFV